MTQGRNTYHITSTNGNLFHIFPLAKVYIGIFSSLFRLLPPFYKITFINTIKHLFNTLFLHIRAYYAFLCAYVVIFHLKVIKCWLKNIITPFHWHDKISLGLSTINIPIHKQFIHFKVQKLWLFTPIFGKYGCVLST